MGGGGENESAKQGGAPFPLLSAMPPAPAASPFGTSIGAPSPSPPPSSSSSSPKGEAASDPPSAQESAAAAAAALSRRW